jgi:hypothetical protein
VARDAPLAMLRFEGPTAPGSARRRVSPPSGSFPRALSCLDDEGPGEIRRLRP